MRSVRFERFGEPAEVLRVEDVPVPAPGPGEALVRLRARSINPADLLTVRGLYGSLPRLPATPGMEAAGVIEAVGPDVEKFQAGQRVIPIGAPGTWQEYVVAKATQLVPTPETLSDAVAAQFVVNPLTAWLLLTEEISLGPGDWLLQTAAGSTLGRMVIQIAKLRGFNTINVVRRRDAVAELTELGAGEVICSADDDLVERVMGITAGKGATAAIDAVSGAVGGSLVRALRPGGTMLVYGALSMEPIPLDAGQMIFRGLTVRGFWLSQWMRSAPAERRQAVMGELLQLMARGALVPPVEASYDLADVRNAVRHADTPGRHGKILLVG